MIDSKEALLYLKKYYLLWGREFTGKMWQNIPPKDDGYSVSIHGAMNRQDYNLRHWIEPTSERTMISNTVYRFTDKFLEDINDVTS